MNNFKFSRRSLATLAPLHPHLQMVATLALKISAVDFVCYHGMRTLAQQKHYVKMGASWTMNSAHLTGYALDSAPLKDGDIDWDDLVQFEQMANAFRMAADELGVPIRWGGDWDGDGSYTDERHYDGPHIELDKTVYDWKATYALDPADPVKIKFDLLMAGEPLPDDPVLLDETPDTSPQDEDGDLDALAAELSAVVMPVLKRRWRR